MNVNFIIGAAGIPEGFKLCNNEIIKHPTDNAWGALLKNETTGTYIHYVAGTMRSIDQKKAQKMDNN